MPSPPRPQLEQVVVASTDHDDDRACRQFCVHDFTNLSADLRVTFSSWTVPVSTFGGVASGGRRVRQRTRGDVLAVAGHATLDGLIAPGPLAVLRSRGIHAGTVAASGREAPIRGWS